MMMLKRLDIFRTIPKDLAESSVTGAVMTIAAVAVCAILFMCEVTAFMTGRPRTDVVIDSNQDELLRINFDVHMLDMCAAIYGENQKPVGNTLRSQSCQVFTVLVDLERVHRSATIVASTRSFRRCHRDVQRCQATWKSR